MRLIPSVLLSLAFLTLAGGAAAHPPAGVHVRRLDGPAVAPGTALPSRFEAERRARLERWRAFPDLWSHPEVDWSPRAARRASWRPPALPLRDPHAGPVPGRALGSDPETIRVALIRIDFANDREGSNSTGTGRFDLGGPDTLRPPLDRPPRNRTYWKSHLEALGRYYEAQGYDRVVIEGDVWPRIEDRAYTVSDMADYGPWAFSQSIYRAAVDMFRSFVIAADTQSVDLGDRVPWDQYDRVLIVHAGSDLQSDVRQDSPLDIPSFTIGVVDTDRVVIRDLPSPGDSLFVDRASFVPETIEQDGYFGTVNGVIAHECGHLLFGFTDVYNTETGAPTVGYWSLMDSGNLLGSIVQLANGDEIYATGLLPPSVDPFQRFFVGDALDFIEADYGDTMELASVARSPDVRRVRLSSDEYLLLENRWQAPAATVELDQDSVSRVILGPKSPDRFEYDALLPGSGVLVWQIDASIIPFSFSLRVNPDYSANNDPARKGIKLIEADGLADIGDPGSPFLLGSYRDLWYRSNNPVLSDSTRPPIESNVGSRSHVRLEFLDEPDSLVRIGAFRAWRLPGWPVLADFPAAGPLLLAVDADGDRRLEVCWAGGYEAGPDSASLFALRPDGQGLFGASPVFATLDARPRPPMSAIPTGDAVQQRGPSLFAVSTYPTGPDLASPGGRVWLLDHTGLPLAGWPATLPSRVTTPPVIEGVYPSFHVLVGCEDGRVYRLNPDGTIAQQSAALFAGGVAGRLAVATGFGAAFAPDGFLIAAGGAQGDVALLRGNGLSAPTDRALDVSGELVALPGWPQRIHGAGFEPEFLWLDFDGPSAGGTYPAGDPSGCGQGSPEVVVHHADLLWAFCAGGRALPGWGRDYGDTLATGLAAGDPDGDGFPEVVVQSWGAEVSFLNLDGAPSPGWPRRGSRESRLSEDPELTFPDPATSFASISPPLALDVAGDGRTRVVALNASGLLAAFDSDGVVPAGFPLASGAGAGGAPLAVDLDRNGTTELVAPDRFGLLYAYSLPVSESDPASRPWPMLGGDPGRSGYLPPGRGPVARAASAGPLEQGSLVVYPNPARQRPVSFSYRLTEPAEVEVRILDAAGREVARFPGGGLQADNVVRWDPSGVPGGLYLARFHFRSAGREMIETAAIGVVR